MLDQRRDFDPFDNIHNYELELYEKTWLEDSIRWIGLYANVQSSWTDLTLD